MNTDWLLDLESTVKAVFQKPLGGGVVECGVCERRCRIPPGGRGACGNRVNLDGTLYNIGYGLLSALESRPIEIKPFFHFWPGSTAMTFSGYGCNMYCPWCQNYHLSFNKPDPKLHSYTLPEKVVEKALAYRDEGVCASFNEPTIHLEYLLDVFTLASKKGLYSTIVSNGYMSIESLKAMANAGLDALNIDIKGCPETYSSHLHRLDPKIVFRNAVKALEIGLHVEMVFLVVTGANDEDDCIDWVLRNHVELLGEEVPLHVNRYYPAYKYLKPPTDIDLLVKIYNKAKSMGIKYVYVGNIWDPSYEATYCPSCGETLIYRLHYRSLDVRLGTNNSCPKCGQKIPIRGKIVLKRRRFLI